MKSKPRLTEIFFSTITVIGIIGSILSVIVGIYLVIMFTVSSSKPSESSILASVLGVMLFIAISNLDRYHKLRHIDIESERTRELIENRIVQQVRADAFFTESLELTEDYFATASSIDIAGITLGKTARTFVDILGRRLIAGDHIRFILVSKDESVLNQLVHRSFGQPVPTVEYYQQRIEATLTLINIVAGINGATGTIEVGMLKYVPSFGMSIVDQSSSNGKAAIEVYHHNSQKPGPKFEVTETKDPKWFYFFNEQFRLMWESCDTQQLIVKGNLTYQKPHK